MWKFSPKILFFLVSFVTLTNQLSVSGAELKCRYLDDLYYHCKVIDNGIFTGERVSIDSAEGEHDEGRTNRDVNLFYLDKIPNVNYFPQNLENIFGDLLLITISSSGLKEIKQQDIKAFTKLEYLDLSYNKITTLDADLFKFNPELENIYVFGNEITHIAPHVFDHLDKLTSVVLNLNKCKNTLLNERNSRLDVSTIRQLVNNGDCD